MPSRSSTGAGAGAVWGTSWHGALESNDFRRAFLAESPRTPAAGFRPAPDTDFAALREHRFDVLADLVADHLDTAALRELIESGPTPGLPVLAPRG